MPGVTQVQSTLNGEVINFLCEPRQSLLEVLRDVLGMTGTKEGCNDGNCGACTIILDGRIVDSCLVLGVEAAGAEITTIEGMACSACPHPPEESDIATPERSRSPLLGPRDSLGAPGRALSRPPLRPRPWRRRWRGSALR